LLKILLVNCSNCSQNSIFCEKFEFFAQNHQNVQKLTKIHVFGGFVNEFSSDFSRIFLDFGMVSAIRVRAFLL